MKPNNGNRGGKRRFRGFRRRGDRRNGNQATSDPRSAGGEFRSGEFRTGEYRPPAGGDYREPDRRFDAPVNGERRSDQPIPTKPASGVLDLTSEGFGFLRSVARNFDPSADDVFVPGAMVRRFGLRDGNFLEGQAGPPRGRGGNLSLDRIDKIDGLDPEQSMQRAHYKELTSIDPTERFIMEGPDNDPLLRILDLLTPIGRGQRGLIVASPRSGKTVILQKIAQRIQNGYPDAHLMVLLIDERPEEATDFKRAVTKGEVIYSTNDEPASRSIRVAELASERAKRLLEAGRDVVILMDSLTRLGRAYNVEIKNSGRTLSGGIDARTLEKPKSFFGAARNVENGGSLTILATALVETGSRMDEVIFEEFKGTGNMELVLSRQLADRRIWPAIDINKSGTRREERMVDAETLERMWMLRRVLNKMNPIEGMELLLKKVKETRSNAEFLAKFAIVDD
ncbi:MAG: transcription termination factor Rho [Planctomycetota bacterium]